MAESHCPKCGVNIDREFIGDDNCCECVVLERTKRTLNGVSEKAYAEITAKATEHGLRKGAIVNMYLEKQLALEPWMFISKVHLEGIKKAGETLDKVVHLRLCDLASYQNFALEPRKVDWNARQAREEYIDLLEELQTELRCCGFEDPKISSILYTAPTQAYEMVDHLVRYGLKKRTARKITEEIFEGYTVRRWWKWW